MTEITMTPATLERLNAVRRVIGEAGANSLLVTTPANVRYVSGFSSPEDAVLVITPTSALLITDARYTAQAAQESRVPFRIVAQQVDAIADASSGKLAVEGDNVSVSRYRQLAKAVGHDPVVVEGVFNGLRVVKDADEIAALRRAAHVTDIAFSEALKMMRPGVSEVEVALCLENAMRLNGAEKPSFETIVASGIRGAMPHGVASQKLLAAGDLVTLDFGAVVDGYHADMTRTVAIGEVGAEERRLFDAVLEAQIASVAAIRPGKTGREIDAVARDILASHNLAEHFVHSLGHGTGMVIHEEPRLSQKSDSVLQPGMIVTVEPGVYIQGFTGLRIEDLILVTENGHEVLSKSNKEFIAV